MFLLKYLIQTRYVCSQGTLKRVYRFGSKFADPRADIHAAVQEMEQHIRNRHAINGHPWCI